MARMLGPLYTPLNVTNPAYQLLFTWSGWLSSGTFPPLPPLDELTPQWESDGLRLLEQQFQPQLIQFTFSVTPQVSPVFFAGPRQRSLVARVSRKRPANSIQSQSFCGNDWP